jgi:hypothetical protein
MENFGTATKVSEEFTEDEDIQLWLKMGRMAFFFCLWMSMAIPVLLLISIRF